MTKKTLQMQVRISEKDRENIEKLCKYYNVKISSIVRMLIAKEIRELEETDE